jgi:hypothetical protein
MVSSYAYNNLYRCNLLYYDGQEPLEITGKDFTETFAKLINAYWQDLTEEECKQIKNILEPEVRE